MARVCRVCREPPPAHPCTCMILLNLHHIKTYHLFGQPPIVKSLDINPPGALRVDEADSRLRGVVIIVFAVRSESLKFF